ncbi:MAG: tetratricopeptide repeat protein [Deltaproteobacteria bacterium]|nr:tetratricopeptide repeat protein [Deltaproteobacteria bacterium]
MSLGFGLEFRDGVALVTLTDRRIGALRIDRLELEVPDVSFPFDVTGSAEQFQNRRCRLRLCSLSIEEQDLAGVLFEALGERGGVEDLQVFLVDGCGLLAGRFKMGGSGVPFTARFAADPEPDLSLRIGFFDIRFFGWMPVPPCALVSRMAQGLRPVVTGQRGAAWLEVRPVRDLLYWLLPMHGWKVPDIEDVHSSPVTISKGRMHWTAGRVPRELAARSLEPSAFAPGIGEAVQRRFLLFKEGAEAYLEAERALSEGRLDEASTLYLGKGEVAPGHPLALQRMLEIGLTRPDHYTSVEDRIRDVLARDPDNEVALLARAILREHRGDAAAGQSYERLGRRWAELGQAVDSVIAHKRAGGLLEDSDLEGAIRNLERVAVLDPEDLASQRRLAGMYERAQRWYPALRTWLRLARRLELAAEVASCHARMGAIYLERLDDLERARQQLDAALTHDPGCLQALQLQATVQQRRAQPIRAAQLLSRILETLGAQDGPEAKQAEIETRLKLARLWEEDLGDPSIAFLHYSRILEDRPDHLYALSRIGYLALDRDMPDRAAEALSRLLELDQSGEALPDDVLRSASLSLGRLYMQRRDGDAEARRYLSRAVELQPESLEAWSLIEEVDRRRGDFSSLVDVLEQKSALIETAEAAYALTEAARLCMDELQDSGRAERLFRATLDLQPDSEEAIGGLTEILAKGERWTELESVLVRTLRQDTAVEQAASRWLRIGQLRIERLKDSEGGVQAMALADKLDPGNREIQTHLLDLYREQHRRTDFVDLVPRLDPAKWPPVERIDLWLERAELLAGDLDRPQEAIESYRRALELDPDLQQAHRALSDLYFEARRWEEARASIAKVLELAGEGGLSGPGRADLHRRLAKIELAQGNLEQTEEQLKTVLRFADRDEDAATELTKLYRELGRWEELAALYARRAGQAEGEAAAALHTAAAAIWWEKLKKPEPAASQYRAAIDAAPDSDGAPARLASLQRVYAGLGRWREVLEVIRHRIELSDEKLVPSMYMAMGSILSARLQEPESAEACWERALEIDPDHIPALFLLARRRCEQERDEEALAFGLRALELDRAHADRAVEETEVIEGVEGEEVRVGRGGLPVERRAALALDVARAAWKLERLDEAVELYQEHLEAFANRGYAGACPEAVERLELLLRKLQRYEDLALLYQRWLKSGLLPERHRGLRRSLALLQFEHLDLPEEAIEGLSEHVRQFPQDQAAVRDLLDMLEKSARWEQLVRLLDEQWELAPDRKERIERLEELAEVLQLRLHDPRGAIDKLTKLLELGHEPAIERLSGIYRQEGLFAELTTLLRERAESEDDPASAADLWSRLGEVAMDELHDRQLALDAYQQAYLSIPSPERRDALLELLREYGPPEQVAAFLAEAAAEEEEPEQRRDLLLEHADICLSRLDQTTDGLASMREALHIRPEESIARRAQSLYERAEDWEGVADMQEVLVDLSADDGTAARRIHRLGRIYAEHLDAPERAIAAFKRATDLDPGWMEAARDLATLLSVHQRWEDQVQIQLRIAQASESRQEKTEALRTAARICFEEIDDAQQGLSLLRRAVEVSGEPLDLLRELADRLEEADELAEAADTLEQIAQGGAEMASGGLSTAALYRRIAELRERSGEEAAAIAAYERTLMQEPSDEESARKLESLYRDLGRFEDLAQMLSGLAQRSTGKAAAGIWLAVARSWLEVDEREAAESALQNALTASPGHEEASAMLASMAGERGDWDRFLVAVAGLPDEMLEREDLSKQVLACWEAIAAEPDSREQELAACRLMLRLDPIHLDALQRAARLLDAAGQAEEAESHLRRLDEQADRLTPDERYDLDLRLANLDFARGRTDEVEQRLKRCVETRPDDPGPRAFLHKIYSGGRRFDERVKLLLDEAEMAESGPERFEKVRAAAQLMELELGDPAGAAELYERVLNEDPERLEAWRKLAELRRLSNNPAKQREALLWIFELASGEERSGAIRKAARLAEDALGDSVAARHDWEALVQIAPGDAEALEHLLRLDRDGQDHAQLDRHLAERLESCTDPSSRAALLRERAGLLDGELERSEEAIGLLEELRGILPADQDALEKLSELYARFDRWENAAEVLVRRVDLAGTEKDRVPLLMELGRVRLDKLGEQDGAVDAFRQAALLVPDEVAPLLQLRELAVQRGDRALLVDTLDALAARSGSEAEEIELRRSVGLLRFANEQKTMAEKAFSRVLALAPGDAVSRRFLARILFERKPREAAPHLRWLIEREDLLSSSDRLRCRRQLVEALTDAEPNERIEAIESLLSAEPDNLSATRALADLYREVGDRHGLGVLLERLAELEAGQDPAIWIERAEILSQEGDFERAVAALERALMLDGTHRFDVAVRLAKLQSEQLGDQAGAAKSLEVALGEQPDNPALLEQLSDLYEGQGRWEDAARSVRRQIELCEQAQRSGLLVRLGSLQLAGDAPARARDSFEEAIEADPACRSAYEKLHAMVEAAGEEGAGLDLGAFYRRWAEGPAAGARRAELYELAASHLEAAGDETGAIESLQAAAKIDPGRLETWRRLLPLLRTLDRPEELTAACGQLVERSDDPAERAELLFEMGRMARAHAHDLERATDLFQDCLEQEPEHRACMEALADLHYEQSHWKDAESLYERLAGLLGESDRNGLAFRRGHIAEELGKREQALAAFRTAVKTAPEKLEAHLGLIRMLDQLGQEDEAISAVDSLVTWAGEQSPTLLDGLREELEGKNVRAHVLASLGEAQVERKDPGIWIERADLLQKAGRMEQAIESMRKACEIEGPHRFDLLLKLASSLEDQGEVAGAIDALERALKHRPDSIQVLQRLSRLYWECERFAQAGQVTARLLEQTPLGESLELVLRLGDIHLALDQLSEAQKAFGRAIKLDPACRPAWERLEQLVAGSENRGEVGRFYLDWARGPAAGDKQAALLLTAARQLERGGETALAVEALQEALRIHPDDVSLLEALAPLLGQEQRWEDLLDVLQRRMEQAGESERKAALAFEMAEVHKEHLNDIDKAAGCFSACLAKLPDHAGALEELADIRYRQEAFDEVAELYRRLGDRVTPSRRFLVHFRRGEIADLRKDLEQALVFYTESTNANPAFIDARQSRIRVLAALRRWDEMIAAIQALLEILPEEGFADMETELYRQLGRTQRRMLRFDDAVESYSRVLQAAPDDLEAVRVLKAIHNNRMNWAEAARFARRELALARDLPAVAERWVELGDLLRLRLQEPAKAEEAYREAIGADPTCFDAKWKLWQILRSKGAWEELRQLGSELLEAGMEDEHKAELHRVIGRAILMARADPSEALDHFEQAIDLAGADQTLLDEVIELARKTGRWDRFASWAGQRLEIQIASGIDPEGAMEGYLRLSRVYQEALKDVGKAAACVRRALELHPRDPELLRRLGILYSSNFDTYLEAIEVFREIQGMDPADPDVYRYLARLEAARGEMDRALCYYTGLRFFSPADPEARRLIDHFGPAADPGRPLERAEWDRIVLHPGADCLPQRILAALAPFIEQLFPANLSRFRAHPGVPSEVSTAVEEAQRLVSGRPVSVLMVEENVYRAWLESGPKPIIAVSRAVVERSNLAELKFFLAREVVAVAMGCVLPLKFTRSDLELLLAILSKMARPDYQPPTPLPPTAPQYVDAIRRVVPADVLELVTPLIRRYALEPRAHDVAHWLEGVRRTADRTALLACGSLNASLSVLTRFSEAAGGRDLAFIPDRAGLVGRDEDMLALLRFAFSEPYFHLRRELGLSAAP